ncbi:hypothetical protein Tco_0651489 [Tanacetum coccineum]|uniref:Uncharacterized protein n=1 Tax=Tanacetum coccineum TaxID=301880 RepID=A0ABQ4WV33_9ASTR
MKQQTSTNSHTSVVAFTCGITRGKSGLQNLEEPASNEALKRIVRQEITTNFYRIDKKMQKKASQQDKLKRTPKARHQSPASLEDSSKTDLLYLGSGRRRREMCSIDWEEKNQARIHALIVPTRVLKQGGKPIVWVPARKASYVGTSSPKNQLISESEGQRWGSLVGKSKIKKA